MLRSDALFGHHTFSIVFADQELMMGRSVATMVCLTLLLACSVNAGLYKSVMSINNQQILFLTYLEIIWCYKELHTARKLINFLSLILH